jgi:hypothetical protein
MVARLRTHLVPNTMRPQDKREQVLQARQQLQQPTHAHVTGADAAGELQDVHGHRVHQRAAPGEGAWDEGRNAGRTQQRGGTESESNRDARQAGDWQFEWDAVGHFSDALQYVWHGFFMRVLVRFPTAFTRYASAGADASAGAGAGQRIRAHV